MAAPNEYHHGRQDGGIVNAAVQHHPGDSAELLSMTSINSPEPLARRKLSPTKRMVFRIMMAGLVLFACELMALAGLALVREGFSIQGLRREQQSIAEGAKVSDGASEAFHPYLGWVHNPQLSKPGEYSGGTISTNWLGFRDDSESIYHRSPDTYIIGIAGGSVAWEFSWEAQHVLREKLAAHPSMKGRQIQFVRLALPGYKQPQHLMAYNFLLTLGAEFDAIINIDGYNETVLTICDNAEVNTAISYPRAWHGRVVAMADPSMSADAARLLQLRGKRQQMAKSAQKSIWRWSYLYNLIWLTRDRSAWNEQTDLGLIVSNSKRHSFTTHGPENRFTGDALEPEVAAMWQRCSLQMHHLCQANDTLYLHVLQPNQYVPDSKPLSEKEVKDCIAPNEDSAHFVPRMFPRLQELGRALEKNGVEFSDQTMVFSGVEKTLYVDPWCHFNQEGNRLLGIAIADRLLQVLDKAALETSDLQN